MAKAKKRPTTIKKIEIPIPPKALKTGLRLKFDISEKKARLHIHTLAAFT